jgi:alkanesulfonate monooxygenase SsuD/methylene tetrahydromethanopterin reductase-like flavin-dependent oxidoreductase (luciferase family)
MGVDLSQWDLDEPLGDVESNAIQSAAANIAAATGEDGSAWTIRDLARHTAIGGLGPVTVGSGATIADRLVAIQEQTDVDGFNLAYAVTPGTWEDVIEFVVPELRARGVYPEGSTPGSLRHKLFGRGDRLPAEHRGAGFRVGERSAV